MQGSAGVRQVPGDLTVAVSWAGEDVLAQSAVAVVRPAVTLSVAQGRQSPPPGADAGGLSGLGQQIRGQTLEAVEGAMRAAEQRAEIALQQAREAGNQALVADREAELAGIRTALARIGQQTEQSTTVPSVQGTDHIPDVPVGAVIITLALFTMVVLLVLGIPLVRARGRRSERPQVVAQPDLEAREQLREIGHAVDAIAIEVERISSRQRQLESTRAADRAG